MGALLSGSGASSGGGPPPDADKLCEEVLWRIRRIRRRIRKGYYDRPEVRARIIDSLVHSLLDETPPPPR